ncbi:Monoterpene epsilon-lactone hydrolase [Phytophthora cinnamomi]|uniref:Monoterpene epsilon-lactone hydrolase n=1 Tax=Phytophthora cinnamomi TaxID=4785 RepID=UPI00355A5131|nr:Monoterpene epsilon-lactone hydrolase [Phytophthora cinnamomi]
MKHVRQFKCGRVSGYGAAYTLPVFLTVAAISLWANATHLQWLGLAHIAVLLKLVLLLGVHELLRPFCLSFGDVCALAARVGSAANAAALQLVRRGLRPKFAEWTLWYECFQAVAFAAGQRHGGHILKRPNARAFRRNFELVGRLLGFWACWRHGHQLQSFRFNGLEHLWLRPGGGNRTQQQQQQSKARQVVVLYFHGGGYALFSPRFFVEFASRLLTQVRRQLRAAKGEADAAVDVQVLLANYRKLPEVSFPAPLDDAMAMFDYLVSEEQVSPSDIVLAGDSAGGGLVLATLLRLRRARREMPLAALCNCPYADLSADVAVSEHCFISKSMLDAIRDLCVLEGPRASWREGAMLHTDLRGLPPLFVQAAEFDILHRQSLALARNARYDGVQVELDVHAHMPHVFTLFPHFMMPQSSVGIDRFAAFITRHLVVTSHRIPVQLPGAAPAFKAGFSV